MTNQDIATLFLSRNTTASFNCCRCERKRRLLSVCAELKKLTPSESLDHCGLLASITYNTLTPRVNQIVVKTFDNVVVLLLLLSLEQRAKMTRTCKESWCYVPSFTLSVSQELPALNKAILLHKCFILPMPTSMLVLIFVTSSIAFSWCWRRDIWVTPIGAQPEKSSFVARFWILQVHWTS